MGKVQFSGRPNVVRINNYKVRYERLNDSA